MIPKAYHHQMVRVKHVYPMIPPLERRRIPIKRLNSLRSLLIEKTFMKEKSIKLKLTMKMKSQNWKRNY